MYRMLLETSLRHNFLNVNGLRIDYISVPCTLSYKGCQHSAERETYNFIYAYRLPVVTVLGLWNGRGN